jgi:hypothetical protein
MVNRRAAIFLLPNRLKRPASLRHGRRRVQEHARSGEAKLATTKAHATGDAPMMSLSCRQSRQLSAAPKSTAPTRPRNWPFPIRHGLDQAGSRPAFWTDRRTEASEASMRDTLVKLEFAPRNCILSNVSGLIEAAASPLISLPGPTLSWKAYGVFQSLQAKEWTSRLNA